MVAYIVVLTIFNVFQIESNNIFATINIKDGMVIFHDDPEKYNNPKVLEEIEQKVSVPNVSCQSRCSDYCYFKRYGNVNLPNYVNTFSFLD